MRASLLGGNDATNPGQYCWSDGGALVELAQRFRVHANDCKLAVNRSGVNSRATLTIECIDVCVAKQSMVSRRFGGQEECQCSLA